LCVISLTLFLFCCRLSFPFAFLSFSILSTFLFKDQESTKTDHRYNKKSDKKLKKKYRGGKGHQLKAYDALLELLNSSKHKSKPKGKDLKVNLKKRIFTTKKEIKDFKTLVSWRFLLLFGFILSVSFRSFSFLSVLLLLSLVFLASSCFLLILWVLFNLSIYEKIIMHSFNYLQQNHIIK
jgi:hypothetical protein